MASDVRAAADLDALDADRAGGVNAAATCAGTRALGPGLRSAGWAQGSSFRGRRCIAPGRMKSFLKANPVLWSRFTERAEFPGYSDDGLDQRGGLR